MRQDDGTHTLIGLRLADGVFALPLAVESAAHLQRTGVPIEVAPLQTADLAAAQAGHQLRLEEVPPHLVLLHYLEEGIQLRTCLLYTSWFFVPNHFTVGGFTGVAQIINHFLPMLPVGTIALVLNIPLFILGWRKIGRDLLISSCLLYTSRCV